MQREYPSVLVLQKRKERERVLHERSKVKEAIRSSQDGGSNVREPVRQMAVVFSAGRVA